MQGAGTGFTVGGPVGAVVGAGLGLIGGLLQGADARKKMAAYQKAENAINPIDPQQVALRNRLEQQERAYRAGTDPSSAFAMQAQRNAMAQTQNNLVRSGAGSVSNLLRSQMAGNLGMAQVGAQAAARADQLIPLQGQITSALAERQYQRQQQLRAAALARAEQSRQDLFNTFAGGLAVLPQITGGFSKAAGQTFDPMRAAAPTPTGPMYGPDLPVNRMQPRFPQPTPLSYQWQ